MAYSVQLQKDPLPVQLVSQKDLKMFPPEDLRPMQVQRHLKVWLIGELCTLKDRFRFHVIIIFNSFIYYAM